MLKQSKKWFSLLLTICLLAGLIATSSFAEENSDTCVHAQRTYCTDPCPTCGKADEHSINSETGMCEICSYSEGNNDSDGDSNGDSNGDSSGDSSCEHEWNSNTGKCNKCSIPCVHDYRSRNGICATCSYTCDHPEYYLEYRPYGNSEHSVRCADCGICFKKERCVDENKNDSYSCDICKKSVVTSDNGITIEGNRNYFTFTPTAAGKYIIFCSNPSVNEGIIVEVYLPDKSSESNFDFEVIGTCDISSQGYTLTVTPDDIGKTYTLLCRDYYDRLMTLKYTLNIINSTCMQKINVGEHFEISKISTSWFSFTPTESGNYTVVSAGKENTKLSVWLKGDNGVINFYDDTYRIASCDTGGFNDNFSYTQNFEKDKEYILECSTNDGSYGEYAVYLINKANCSHLWNKDSGECELCGTHCSHDNYSSGIQSVVKATTSTDGKVIKTCKTCGKKYTESVIAKIASIKLSKTTYVYNGKTCTPEVVVLDANGKRITSFKTTNSSGSKNVGTYTVNISFTGNYSGSTKLAYTIIPKTTSFKLSKASKSFKVSWTKISSQCSGYQIQYSLNSNFKNAKTKTITSFKKTSAKVSGLKSKKVYYVRMRTYRKLGEKTYYSSWSAKKSTRVK